MTYLNNLKNILSNKKFDYIILLTTIGLLNGHNIYASSAAAAKKTKTEEENKKNISGEHKNPEIVTKEKKVVEKEMKIENLNEIEFSEDIKKNSRKPEISDTNINNILETKNSDEKPKIKKEEEKQIEIENSVSMDGFPSKNTTSKIENTSNLVEKSIVQNKEIDLKEEIQLHRLQSDVEEESTQMDPVTEAKVVKFLKEVNKNKNVTGRLNFLNDTGRFRVNKGGCLCCSNLEDGSVTVLLPNPGLNQQMPTMKLKEMAYRMNLLAEEDKKGNDLISEEDQVQSRPLEDYNKYMYSPNNGVYKPIVGYLDFAGKVLFTGLGNEGLNMGTLQGEIKELDENFIAYQTEDESSCEMKSIYIDSDENINEHNKMTSIPFDSKKNINIPEEKTSSLRNTAENVNENKNINNISNVSLNNNVKRRKVQYKKIQHNRNKENALREMRKFGYAQTPQGEKLAKKIQDSIEKENKKLDEEEEELIKKELNAPQTKGRESGMGLGVIKIITNNKNENGIKKRRGGNFNTQKISKNNEILIYGQGVSHTQQVIENLSKNKLSNNSMKRKKFGGNNLNNNLGQKTKEKKDDEEKKKIKLKTFPTL